MTLRIHNDLVQGSDEWYDVRRGMVTASVVGQLITPKTVKPAANPESRALTAQLAAERITGWTETTYINYDMQRGIDCEPLARDKYAEHYAPVIEAGFMVEDEVGLARFSIGYSPDGLVGDDGLIEIKCPRPKGHLQTILADHPPIEHMAQLQCGLLVSGRQWIDYISWCGGMPMYVKRVYPQLNWLDAILEASQATEDNIAEMMRLYNDSIPGLHPTERTDWEIVI